MKTFLVIATTSLLAFSVPALAQQAGAPGATGTGGSLTGSNTGTGWGPGTNFAPDNSGSRFGNEVYPNDANGAYMNRGGGYMNEGRASAPDYDPSGSDAPRVYAPRPYGSDVDGPNSDR